MATMMMTMMGDDYDAFDAMMDRGAFLRKLRELEAQDEAERAANAEEHDEAESDADEQSADRGPAAADTFSD